MTFSSGSEAMQSNLVNALKIGHVTITCSDYNGLAEITNQQQAKLYTAPAPTVLLFVVDFGLFRECFDYSFPIPQFDNPLSTSVCFSKNDLCRLVDSTSLTSAAADMNARDVQKDMSIICKYVRFSVRSTLI